MKHVNSAHPTSGVCAITNYEDVTYPAGPLTIIWEPNPWTT